ncbi:MAG TPA: flagellar hook-length control protein FliK [Stellaceae bacterium]|nr:flagellar hook-length control protein FliK [Stellaceae bacterium]
MSSLRIGHQNRAIAPPTGGDTGRSEHADDSGFALALGAAAGLANKNMSAPLGSQSGEAPGSLSGSRKRGDNSIKSNDVTGIVSGLAGALVAATTVADASSAAPNADAATIAGATVGTPLLGVAPLAQAGQAISGRSGILDRDGGTDDNLPATPTGAPDGSSPSAGGAPTPESSFAAATTDANLELLGQEQSDQTIATALAEPDGVAAAGSPDIATLGAAADPTGVPAVPGSATSAGSRSDATRGLADSPSGTPLSLFAFEIGQSAMPDVGDRFASTSRDRFAPIAGTPDAPGVAATAAIGPGGDASVVSASATAMPGPDSDPAGAGSIADQVAGQLARAVSNGTREVTIRLHPPELGDLTVRVAVNGRDVSAWFASPQPQVQTAISAALGQLQTNLGNAGYNLSGAWVGDDASGARRQGWSASPTSLRVDAPLAVSAGVPAATTSLAASSGLNIYV